MTIEAKFTTTGITKGKQYNVIKEITPLHAYQIILNDGTTALRHKFLFNNMTMQLN